MIENHLKKSLALLDITHHDSDVLLSLYTLGPSNAGPIIKATGLHRQFVYSALERLKDRGLVSFVVRSGRRVFEAAPPQRLIAAQRDRERLAQDLVPHLEKLSAKSADRLVVQTLRGIGEFQQNLITVLEEASKGDGILRVIGGGSDSAFYDVLGNFYDVYVRTAQRLKVRKHLLAPSHLSTKFKGIFAKEKGTQLRLSESLASPTYTRITPELTTIEVYSSDPMIIQIWNRAIAQSHREHFEMLWQRGIKV